MHAPIVNLKKAPTGRLCHKAPVLADSAPSNQGEVGRAFGEHHHHDLLNHDHHHDLFHHKGHDDLLDHDHPHNQEDDPSPSQNFR